MNQPDIRRAHILAILLGSLVGCGGGEGGLGVEGQLEVADCGNVTSTDFDFSFDVARP